MQQYNITMTKRLTHYYDNNDFVIDRSTRTMKRFGSKNPLDITMGPLYCIYVHASFTHNIYDTYMFIFVKRIKSYTDEVLTMYT